MKRNKIISFILASAVVVTISGCAKPMTNGVAKIDTKTTTATSNNKTTSSSISSKDDVTELKEKIKEQETTIEKLKKEANSKDNSASAFKDRKSGLLYFPLVTSNGFDNKSVSSYIAIAPQDSVETKLNALMTAVSTNFFESNPIKLVSIKEVSGKKVATFDLKGDKWSNYFQGSTGGYVTSVQLIETALQKNYTYDWIDGVKFTLNGKDISDDHVPSLNAINYRK